MAGRSARLPSALRAARPTLRATRASYRSYSTPPPPPPPSSSRWAPLLGGLAVGGALTYAAISLSTDQPAKGSHTRAKGAERFGTPDDYRAAIAEIRAVLPEDDVSTDESDREVLGGSEWTYGTNYPPSAVAYPGSTEDVQKIMRICAKYRVPVIPYGSGTSLEGHFSAVSRDMRREGGYWGTRGCDDAVEPSGEGG